MANDKEKNMNYVTVVLVALIASMGGTVTMNNVDDVFQNELGNTYLCVVDNVIIQEMTGEYARLSSTSYTAYPNQDNSIGRTYCKSQTGAKGKWTKLLDYANENGIDYKSLIGDSSEEEHVPTEAIKNKYKYSCNNVGCEAIQ